MQGNLEGAIARAQRLEVYHGGDGAKAGRGGKGSKNIKKQCKGTMAQLEGSLFGGPFKWSRL